MGSAPLKDRPPCEKTAAALRARNLDASVLRLVHALLDSWRGIGLIVVGVARQGFQVSLGDHGPGQWMAVLYRGRGGHERVEAAGTAQAATSWEAVQRAAWEALTRQGPGAGGRLLDFEGESDYDGVLSGGVRGLACTAIHHKSGIVVGNPLDETVSPKRARTRRATR